MKLTADTITDDQIREWESNVLYSNTSHGAKCRAVDLATRALVRIPPMKELLVLTPAEDPRPKITAIKRKRNRARARCAEILNVRSEK